MAGVRTVHSCCVGILATDAVCLSCVAGYRHSAPPHTTYLALKGGGKVYAQLCLFQALTSTSHKKTRMAEVEPESELPPPVQEVSTMLDARRASQFQKEDTDPAEYAKQLAKAILSHIILGLAVTAYVVGGAFLFIWIEADKESDKILMAQNRSIAIEVLFHSTLLSTTYSPYRMNDKKRRLHYGRTSGTLTITTRLWKRWSRSTTPI